MPPHRPALAPKVNLPSRVRSRNGRSKALGKPNPYLDTSKSDTCADGMGTSKVGRCFNLTPVGVTAMVLPRSCRIRRADVLPTLTTAAPLTGLPATGTEPAGRRGWAGVGWALGLGLCLTLFQVFLYTPLSGVSAC